MDQVQGAASQSVLVLGLAVGTALGWQVCSSATLQLHLPQMQAWGVTNGAVGGCRCCCSALMELLSAGLIDLVFSNEDEAAALLEVLPAQADNGAAAAAAGAACVVHRLGFLARSHHRMACVDG